MDLTGLLMPKMDWESTNLPKAWKKFHDYVTLHFEGPLLDKDEEIKVKYLLLWVGDRGREIFATLSDLAGDDGKKFQPPYDRFKRYVHPKLNPIFARFKFNKVMQSANSVKQFVTKLKSIIKDCAYNNPDEMVRDQIVFGISSQNVREKLINVGETLTLDKVS